MKPAFFPFVHMESFEGAEDEMVAYEGLVLLDEIVAILPDSGLGPGAHGALRSAPLSKPEGVNIVLRNGTQLFALGDPSMIIRRWIDEVMKHSAPKPGWNVDDV